MERARGWIGNYLLRGLTILVPVVVALQVLLWLVGHAERMTMTLVFTVLPWDWYVPGMGLVLLAATVFLTGVLIYPWMGRKLDQLLRHVPLFGSLYGPLRDLMNLLGGDANDTLGRPVMVRLPGSDLQTVGFVTRRSSPEFPGELIPPGHVAVYMQWASQVGGLTFVVPESACTPLNISAESAFRFSLTGGASAAPTGGRQGSVSAGAEVDGARDDEEAMEPGCSAALVRGER